MMEWFSDMLPRLAQPFQSLSALQQFMQQGGPILWWLALVVIVYWLLLIERIAYLWLTYPNQQAHWVECWQQRRDHHSWAALAIRDRWLSQARLSLFKYLDFIKVLVAICPMLGLLGTVTGMISVFDVMAEQGSSDPKLMASGISLATLPTMAGMVAALVGMFIHARLHKVCVKRTHHLEKLLRSRSS